MGVFSALVLLAMVWTMTLLILLQVGQRTQGDAGEIVRGTHASSPAEFRFGRKILIATAIALPLWGLLVWVIVSGYIGIDSLPRVRSE